VCDGAFYKNKTVALVGGGNAALQEAILLSETCKKVYVLQNLDFLTGEKRLQDILANRGNVEIITGTVVEKVLPGDVFTGVTVKTVATGETYDLELDGLFVAIGLEPENGAFENVVALDARGYADVDENCETATPGVFVAGDCRRKAVRQVTTATGDGATAAIAACRYIDGM
jgi:thioredoxin reductase (NADPH)